MLAILICCALVFSTLVVVRRADAARLRSGGGQGQGRHGTPVGGPPAADLPNLDEVRRKRHAKPQAPPHVPSVMRGRRKPLVPRRGLKVGDPGTGSVGILPAGAESFPLRSSAKAFASSALKSPSSFPGKRNHLRERTSRANAPAPVGDDTYVQTFFSYALARSPNPTEQAYFNDMLRAAYVHGQTSMVMAAREMGKTLFESADYAARNTSNHVYVQNLYETYLLREPDSGGWAFWESLVPGYGREAIRRAFDECGEFIYDVSTVTPNGSASSNVTSLMAARVDPKNQAGSRLLGRHAGWGLTVVSLPGRAGLDLGLGISYSSGAVWTRSGPYIYFDEDNSSLSPGFRIGFPTVQEKFFNAQISQNAYLLITSAGSRVELRETATAGIYEAADSSYLQLTENNSSNPTSLTLRATDGTQMSYSKIEDEWRCTQIKDRNGNFITVNYNSLGDITTVVDTLNRTITFNYDANANLISIAQSWNGVNHNWATFGWGTTTIAPSFSGVALTGLASGQSIPVVTQVGLPDGSYYKFIYDNGSYPTGLVKTFEHWAVDGLHKGSVAYDYATAAGDIPRLSAAHAYADYWNGSNGVPSDITTTYGTDGTACWATAPDGTIFKESYGADWKKGLVTSSEVWSGGVKQKWTTTGWAHDGANDASYPTNPRVTETTIDDASYNHRRTTIGYTTPFTPASGTSMVLPSDVYEWDALGTMVLRRSHTDYLQDSPYWNRWIIGLPSAKYLCDGAEGAVPCSSNSGTSLFSKTTFQYDAGGAVDYQGVPTQHDAAFDSTTIPGRANATSVTRYDVTNSSQFTVSSFRYNTAGSVISATDPLGHTSTISYTDSFSDSVNHNTLAYPTTATDADGFQSFVQYNFDFGAKTRVQGPPPANQSQGVIQTFTYDDAARIQRVTTTNNGAYTRYVYGPTYVQSYATVNSVADEAYSIQFFDGAGRVYYSAGNHPGSTGGYRGVTTVYDVMGRVWKQSNPTEVNANSYPAGDDAPGWLYTTQTYDWKGRPLVTTNTDQTTKTASYSGCGCAGGEVVTLTDEGTIDPVSNTAKKRQQKIYSDVLGRTVKTETLNWENGNTYSTRTIAYNARDQITSARQYQGPVSNGIYQEETETYDGYGRLATRKAPIQTNATSYTYYANDKPLTVTDGRGATTTYSYNNRGLVTNISYSGPSPVPAAVSFGYDAAGNRTSMNDGTGTTTYQYDELSQLQSETRQFAGLSGNFTLSYTYNLAGQLKSITDPTTSRVDYAYDAASRLLSASGSGANSAASYASGFAYRAWGAVKDFDFGNGVHQHLNFNGRLQNTSLALSNTYFGTMSWSYGYYNDGKLSNVTDSNDPRFDRSFNYDQVGRIADAKTGNEAHGGTIADGPFKQTYSYDVWENAVARTYRVWTQNTQTESVNYPNNRHQSWGYDNEGQVTADYHGNYGYDAASHQNHFTSYDTVGGWPSNNPVQPSFEVSQTFDGNSAPARKITTTRWEEWPDGQPEVHESVLTTYYLRSTALGGKVVAELDNTGYKFTGYIYAGGMQIAEQHIFSPGYGFYVHLLSTSPATGSEYQLSSAGNYVNRKELDPLGADVTTAPDPTIISEPVFYSPKFSNMAMEYEWGPSEEYLQANADWAAQMNETWENVRQMHEAEDLWQSGDRSGAKMILNNNPNVGVETADGKSYFGKDASDFLTGVSASGREIEVVDHFGGSGRHFAHSPQNTEQARKDRDKMLTESLKIAKTLLESHKACSDYLGTVFASAESQLKHAEFFYGGRDDETIAQASPGGPIQWSSITLYDHFYSNNVGGITRQFDLTPAMARALVILHETAHNTGRILHVPGVKAWSQEELDKNIYELCGFAAGGSW